LVNKLIIKHEIIKCIEDGMKDRNEIFTNVSMKLGIGLIQVRRCTKELKQDLIYKAKILGWMANGKT